MASCRHKGLLRIGHTGRKRSQVANALPASPAGCGVSMRLAWLAAFCRYNMELREPFPPPWVWPWSPWQPRRPPPAAAKLPRRATPAATASASQQPSTTLTALPTWATRTRPFPRTSSRATTAPSAGRCVVPVSWHSTRHQLDVSRLAGLVVQVLFMTGADEHGQKIAETAKRQGLAPKELCDLYVSQFQARDTHRQRGAVARSPTCTQVG